MLPVGLIRHEGVTWIAVSDVVCRQLEGLGVPPSRIIKLPAYIPLDGEAIAEEGLPVGVGAFLACHNPVITTYAWMLVRDENGDDLHSLDHCVSLVGELRMEHPNVGLVILLGNASQRDRLEELREHIRRRGVEKQIFICDEPLRDASRLWLASDLYLRATTTDGDSLSVREAISSGVPVIASDAALRPEGTLLFRKRDYQSLLTMAKYVLNNREKCREALKGISMADNFSPLLELYERLGRQ